MKRIVVSAAFGAACMWAGAPGLSFAQDGSGGEPHPPVFEPCDSDADCLDGEICEVAPEDAEEPGVEPGSSYCVPLWILPCEEDFDCGEGFICIAENDFPDDHHDDCECGPEGNCDCPDMPPPHDGEGNNPIHSTDDDGSHPPEGDEHHGDDHHDDYHDGGFCVPAEPGCDSNEQCPADFECVFDDEGRGICEPPEEFRDGFDDDGKYREAGENLDDVQNAFDDSSDNNPLANCGGGNNAIGFTSWLLTMFGSWVLTSATTRRRRR